MRHVLVLAAIVAVFLLAGPPPAQAKVVEDEVAAAKIATDYAACVVGLSPPLARRYLLSDQRTPPPSGECLDKAQEKSGTNAYSGGRAITMRLPGDSYRYALAEALLKVDYKKGIPSVSSVPPFAHDEAPVLDPATLPKKPKEAELARRGHDIAYYAWAMRIVGECVARAKPTEAFGLIQTPPFTPEEKAAFEPLLPTLSACLSGEGTVHFKRWLVRGSIAQNLYRLAFAAAPPSGRAASQNFMNEFVGAASHA